MYISVSYIATKHTCPRSTRATGSTHGHRSWFSTTSIFALLFQMTTTDSISESSDGNETSHSIDLQRELSNSTVPGTPGADSPNSLVLSQGLAVPLFHMGKGTPLPKLNGALKPPSSFSHVVTPLPIRTHRPSKLSASFTFSSPSIQRDYTMEVSNNICLINLL